MNPKARVVTAYLGNWDDAGAGKEQALAQVAQGVDVISQNAHAAGLGIFQAAKESKGVYIIGSNSNQNSVAPTVTLGSVVMLKFTPWRIELGNVGGESKIWRG